MIEFIIDWIAGLIRELLGFCSKTRNSSHQSQNKIDDLKKTRSSRISQEINLKTRSQIYTSCLQAEAGFNAYRMAFLDRGIEGSPYRSHVEEYPQRLKPKIALAIAGAPQFPTLGELPEIDETRLQFLHPEIQEACICIGGTAGGPFKARWLGRNALNKVQFWSTTKIIPILNLLCTLEEDARDACLRDGDRSFGLSQAMDGVMTYDEKIASSNALAATFKCFQHYTDLELWVKNISGNRDLNFRGLYGEDPTIAAPTIGKGDRILVKPSREKKTRTSQPGENLLTAYALTRLMTMAGWHDRLPKDARLPGMRSDNLELFARSGGKDIARYVDVAIEELGWQQRIRTPVILSKVGYGYSDSRRRTEIAYTCFVQLDDGDGVKSLAMTLRAATALGDVDREAVELDARMAVEVSEILRRFLTNRL